MKSVALQCVDDHGCLGGVFEVSKSEVDFKAVLGFPGDETQLFEPRERSKDVRDLAISGVLGQPLDIDGTRRIGWNRDQLLIFELAREAGESSKMIRVGLLPKELGIKVLHPKELIAPKLRREGLLEV